MATIPQELQTGPAILTVKGPIPSRFEKTLRRVMPRQMVDFVFGEIVVQLQGDIPKAKPPIRGYTYGGGENVAGSQYQSFMKDTFPDDEFGYDTIDEMLKTGQVRFALELKKAAILSALFNELQWQIQCQNETLGKVVKADMERIFATYGPEMLTMLEYGSFFGELIWEYVPASARGLKGSRKWWVLEGINTVKPETIDYIRRVGKGPNMGRFDGFTQEASSPWPEHTIPVEQALILTFRKKWRNLWGESILKPGYPLWYWWNLILASFIHYLDKAGDPLVVVKAPMRGRMKRADEEWMSSMDYALLLATEATKSQAVAIPSDVHPETGQPLFELGYMTDDKKGEQYIACLKFLSDLITRSIVMGAMADISKEGGGFNKEEMRWGMTQLDNQMILQMLVSQLSRYHLPKYARYNASGVLYIAMLLVGLDPARIDRVFKFLSTAGNQADGGALDWPNWELIFQLSGIPTVSKEEADKIKEERKAAAEKEEGGEGSEFDVWGEGGEEGGAEEETEELMWQVLSGETPIYLSHGQIEGFARDNPHLVHDGGMITLQGNPYHDEQGRFTSKGKAVRTLKKDMAGMDNARKEKYLRNIVAGKGKAGGEKINLRHQEVAQRMLAVKGVKAEIGKPSVSEKKGPAAKTMSGAKYISSKKYKDWKKGYEARQGKDYNFYQSEEAIWSRMFRPEYGMGRKKGAATEIGAKAAEKAARQIRQYGKHRHIWQAEIDREWGDGSDWEKEYYDAFIGNIVVMDAPDHVENPKLEAASEGVIQLFNPYHDEFGRFTSKAKATKTIKKDMAGMTNAQKERYLRGVVAGKQKVGIEGEKSEKPNLRHKEVAQAMLGKRPEPGTIQARGVGIDKARDELAKDLAGKDWQTRRDHIESVLGSKASTAEKLAATEALNALDEEGGPIISDARQHLERFRNEADAAGHKTTKYLANRYERTQSRTISPASPAYRFEVLRKVLRGQIWPVFYDSARMLLPGGREAIRQKNAIKATQKAAVLRGERGRIRQTFAWMSITVVPAVGIVGGLAAAGATMATAPWLVVGLTTGAIASQFLAEEPDLTDDEKLKLLFFAAKLQYLLDEEKASDILLPDTEHTEHLKEIGFEELEGALHCTAQNAQKIIDAVENIISGEPGEKELEETAGPFELFNPYHDEKGRFTTGPGAGVSAIPKSKVKYGVEWGGRLTFNKKGFERKLHLQAEQLSGRLPGCETPPEVWVRNANFKYAGAHLRTNGGIVLLPLQTVIRIQKKDAGFGHHALLHERIHARKRSSGRMKPGSWQEEAATEFLTRKIYRDIYGSASPSTAYNRYVERLGRAAWKSSGGNTKKAWKYVDDAHNGLVKIPKSTDGQGWQAMFGATYKFEEADDLMEQLLDLIEQKKWKEAEALVEAHPDDDGLVFVFGEMWIAEFGIDEETEP